MRRSIGWTCAGLLLLVVGGCGKKGGAGGEALKLVPKETGILVSVNLDKLRGSKPWDRLTKLRDSEPTTKQKYDDLVKGLGFDPLADGKMVTIAVPQDTSKAKEDFAMVFESNKVIDEKKFVAYATETAKKEGGGELQTEQYGGKTLYGNSKKEDSWLVFLSDKTLVVAGKDSAKKVVDLDAKKGDGADKNAELMAMVGRTDKAAGMWAAGMVPADKRSQVAPGATISGGAVSVDLSGGFSLRGEADAASADEAKKLAETANQQIAQAKANPMLAMMGFAAPVEATKVSADGKAIKVETKLDQAKFDELMTKVEGMAKMMGGGMGRMGGGAPHGGMAPAGGTPMGGGTPPGSGFGAMPKKPAGGEMKLKLNTDMGNTKK